MERVCAGSWSVWHSAYLRVAAVGGGHVGARVAFSAACGPVVSLAAALC